jgi:26S proteasome regulatory subunit N1
MKPRMLLTVDEEGGLLSVPVRLGQAVDVVAQAGRPKTITGAIDFDAVAAGGQPGRTPPPHHRLNAPPPPLHTNQQPTGFQTHTTPVLMNAGERAELGSEKWLPLSPILEGIVILKPNPEYEEVAE